MSIIDGTGLVTWEGGLFEPNSDLLRRTQWVFAQVRAAGGTIILNEAGRPFGVSGDAKVRNASQTASGVSTVWFQWGRYLRGETPSAADPRSGNTLVSEHTQGKAIDCEAPTVFDATLRAKFMAQAGMQQTIPSESWHWAIRGNPTVEIAAVAVSPISNEKKEEEEDMAAAVLLRETNGTIWYAPDDGDLIQMSNADEYNALIACGAVRPVKNPDGSVKAWWIQLSDGLIINKRKAIAARKHAQIASGK